MTTSHFCIHADLQAVAAAAVRAKSINDVKCQGSIVRLRYNHCGFGLLLVAHIVSEGGSPLNAPLNTPKCVVWVPWHGVQGIHEYFAWTLWILWLLRLNTPPAYSDYWLLHCREYSALYFGFLHFCIILFCNSFVEIIFVNFWEYKYAFSDPTEYSALKPWYSNQGLLTTPFIKTNC